MAKNKRKRGKNKQKLSFFWTFLLILFVGGCVGGYYVGDHLTKNDKFEINGDRIIYRYVGESYEDEGATATAFGKKLSDEKIKAENNINMHEPGQYHIKYTVNHIRFRGVNRYRIIVVLEPELPEECEV